MQLPFDSFATLLVWVASAGVVGMVLSLIQQLIKDKLGYEISGKIVAIVLSIVATGAVFIVQFVFKLPIFTDVSSADQLLQIASNFILILLFNQSSYSLVVKRSD